MLHISEIFLSIQGEGIKAGVPTVFIRTQGCSLACKYCDTEYARNSTFLDCHVMKVSECVKLVETHGKFCKDICLTGGSPLEQNLFDIRNLLIVLAQLNFHTTIETSGHKSTEFFIRLAEKNGFGDKVDFCVDYKLPSSGMIRKMTADAFSFLRPVDSVKYVIGDEKDWHTAMQHLTELREGVVKATALFSPVWGAPMNIQELTERVLTVETDLHPTRLSLQLHKIIWGPDKRGV